MRGAQVLSQRIYNIFIFSMRKVLFDFANVNYKEINFLMYSILISSIISFFLFLNIILVFLLNKKFYKLNLLDVVWQFGHFKQNNFTIMSVAQFSSH